jgi:hypothetical protein
MRRVGRQRVGRRKAGKDWTGRGGEQRRSGEERKKCNTFEGLHVGTLSIEGVYWFLVCNLYIKSRFRSGCSPAALLLVQYKYYGSRGCDRK